MEKKHIIFLFKIILLIYFFNACENNITPPPKLTTEGIFVVEDDHIFGGFGDVDNYHKVFIINTTQDSISIDIESPTPEGLKRESMRSPSFGRDAYFHFDYTQYFDIPNMNNDYLTDKPNITTDESYFWNNLKLGPYDAIHVPYSSYMGEGEDLFIKDFGINVFMGLEVISDYSIEHNSDIQSYLNIQIKQTMTNTTKDTLYMVGIVVFIPRELKQNSNNIKLYNLVSDTVIYENRYEYWDIGRVDGFSNPANGQEIITRADTLLPKSSFGFIYRMTIEPLLEKFEIYPMYLISIDTKGKRIWPQSIITVNNKVYEGNVNYMKFCGLSIPTYILFSINNGELKVVSPNDIEPTFSP